VAIMAELKTKKYNNSIEEFLSNIEKVQKRKDSFKIFEMMKEVTGEEPKMWGDSIIGFGDFHYKYKTGREGDWFKIGFSPRKQNIVLYTMNYFKDLDEILSRIGKFKKGKSCFYINKLSDVNPDVLKEFIKQSYDKMSEKDKTDLS